MVIDPLHEPEPSALDGPGTHFTQSPAATSSPASASTNNTGNRRDTNPFRKSSGTTSNASHTRHGSVEKTGDVSTHSRELPSSSSSGHQTRASNDLRREALENDPSRRRSGSASHSRQASEEVKNRPRRSSSLTQRYPGDQTDHPLDMLKKEHKAANRSPHLKKHHQPLPDQVDLMDKSALRYHHEGPYEATLLTRNTSWTNAPIAAVTETNNEALKATPRDKIKDSLNDHRPLDGVAIVPPGMPDAMGRVMDYEEGADLMREDGANYKRWRNVDYHPDDLKGKGEPSYSIEKALKEHGPDRAAGDHRNGEIELAERPKPADAPARATTSGQSYGEWERETQRTSGHSHKLSDGFKRRVGSLRRKEV